MSEYVPSSMFWFTLALVNAGLAEQKGRGRLNWFLLSVILGPFATFYIVATSRPEAAALPAPAPAQEAGANSH